MSASPVSSNAFARHNSAGDPRAGVGCIPDRKEEFARRLVWAMYDLTGGQRSWWHPPGEIKRSTKEAIGFAAKQGWLEVVGKSHIRLTDAGRDLIKEDAKLSS